MREISYPTLFKYFLAALLVFCPLILSKFMYEKKYLFSILFIIIIYLDFSIEGLKSIIFLSFVAICIHLLHKIKLLHYIPIILSILLILSFALNDTLKTAVSFIIWRSIFVSSGIDYQYYTFFNIFDPDYYRNSFLSRFGFESPYSTSSVDIAVGEYFNPDIDGIRANNGLLSDAYANFGSIGCLLYPIMLIFYIKLISACAKYTDEKYLRISAVVFFFAIIATFIPATFFSTGIAYLMLFLLAFSNIRKWQVNN